MTRIGVGAGIAVACGIAAYDVFCCSRTGAILLLACAFLLAARNSRSWILVPAALGLLAAADTEHSRIERSITRPLLAEGWIEVAGAEGRGAVVRIGERSILVARADSLGLTPGLLVRGRLRIDPIRGLEEPAAFRAERWARARSIDGRGRFLGPIEQRVSAPGAAAAGRRFAHTARARVRARLEGPGDAPGELLVALLLGDRSGLEPADREAFRRSGLAHVLALSGMHVSLLAAGTGAVLGACRLEARTSFAVLAVFIVAFTYMTGLLAPVVRACAGALLSGFGTFLGRRTDSLHALGIVAAAMLLLSPPLLGDLGFRLSFLATAVLLLGAGSVGRAGKDSSRGLRRALRGAIDGLRISCAIVLATAPDLAQSMGRSSVLAPFTNIASQVPSFAALGWGAVAGFAPLPREVTDRLGRSARAANEVLLETCRVSAELPGADVPTVPLSFAATFLLAGMSAQIALKRMPSARMKRALALAAGLAGWTCLRDASRERLTFLDVGQGDSILIERAGRAILVDGGPPDEDPIRAVTGRSVVGDAVLRRGFRKLDAIVLTHGHLDHAGSFDEILRSRAAALFIVPERDPSAKCPALLRDLEAIADSVGTERLVAPPVRRELPLLGGRVIVASPWGTTPPAQTEENDLSLIVRWNGPGLDAVLTGDLEREGERALLEGDASIVSPAWIFKAGHHGGRTSTGDAILERVRPKVVVASCGVDNTHGHPHDETRERVRRIGAILLRTDREGSIAFTRTGRGIRVRWEREVS